MNLPFLKAKRQAQLMKAVQKPTGAVETTPEVENHPLHEKAEELIGAMHSKDAARVAEILGSLLAKPESIEDTQG